MYVKICRILNVIPANTFGYIPWDLDVQAEMGTYVTFMVMFLCKGGDTVVLIISYFIIRKKLYDNFIKIMY